MFNTGGGYYTLLYQIELRYITQLSEYNGLVASPVMKVICNQNRANYLNSFNTHFISHRILQILLLTHISRKYC